MIELPRQKIFELLNDVDFVATFTGLPRSKRDEIRAVQKVVIKSVVISDVPHYQQLSYTLRQNYTKNLEQTKANLNALLENITSNRFTQAHLQTAQSDYYFRVTAKGISSKTTSPSKKDWDSTIAHNQKKNYLITEENSFELLRALGFSDEKGRIKPSMQAKFKQVNHFISLAMPLKTFKRSPLTIVDCGCGKSYLSLSLYHYLKNILKKEVELVGIDSNSDVIDSCNAVKEQLGYNNVQFVNTQIADYVSPKDVDVVLALHACDTATDDALVLALRFKALAILAAPCCHHYVNDKLRSANAPNAVASVLQDGITRERFADLLTDSMRRDILKAYGYSAELIEFVAQEHTTKNIMIRAEHVIITNPLKDEILSNLRSMRDQWKAAPKFFDVIESHEQQALVKE